MKSLAVLILSFFCLGLGAQTYIRDKQEVSGKWKKSKSPYIIEGEAVIPKGKTLKIQAGVVVKFKTGDNRDYNEYGFNVGFLRVKGKLVAKGSETDFVVFTRDGYSDDWGNIVFDYSSGTSELQYCRIEHSYYLRTVITDQDGGTDNATGALSFVGSNAKVTNCLIVNNGWTGLNTKKGSKPVITNVTISGNNYGVECNSESAPELLNVIVWDNSTAFYINGGAQPSFTYCLLQEALPDEASNNGGNIIGESPEFYESQMGDFMIHSSSPAFQKGKGGKNIGAH